ncbi:MAG TPA: hypothetical protein VGB91_06530 [Rhizomicrobium sp.]
MAATVRAARRRDRIAISAPRDFELIDSHAVAPEAARLIAPLPYCLDLPGRRAIYVGGIESQAAQAAPFYYLHLRRHARRALSAPWETLPLAARPDGAPIFLFSPGRCGSTLLSRLLSAAGVANVSEPDFYTQATSAACASRLNPLRARMRMAVAAMGADLAAALDPARAPVVKLRAESCRAPDLLVGPNERRTLFMTRDFEAWARSNTRAFRNPAAKSVRKYLTALRCAAWLRQNSDCHVVRYEDLLADPAAVAGALGRFVGCTIPPAAVASTMTEDSQDDTPLEKGGRIDRPGWERRFDQTMALWNSAKVKGICDRLGDGATGRGTRE